MGIGEDEALGDAIAVTIIATGFASDQQDDIVNTESKRIIHTLEDEQKAVHNLSAEKPVSNFNINVSLDEPVIKHQLEDVEEPEIKKTPASDLIETTNYIRNFNVFYEEVVIEPEVKEVIAENHDEDFIIIEAKNVINDIDVVDPEVVSAKEEEDQFALTFDMPISGLEEDEKENTITFDLGEEVKDIDVNEYVEVSPVIDYNKEGETRYNLEEYMELETQLTGARSVAETHEPKLVEDELIFEKKTIKAEASAEGDASNQVDPFNSSINDLLKDRADERRKKLKNFNYKFQNNRNSIDEIEKQPAYKRQGVDLDDAPKEQKISRMSLGEDSNDEVQLRSNNSFLHDNVD
jgi:cell division protein FtsZ